MQSKGAWQQRARIEDLRDPRVFDTWLFHLDRVEGASWLSMTLSSKCRRDLVIAAVWETVGVVFVELSCTCSWNTARLAVRRRQQEGHYACVHALSGGLTLANPAITTELRGLTDSTSRPADIFNIATVPCARRGPRCLLGILQRSRGAVRRLRQPFCGFVSFWCVLRLSGIF